jgi:serine/threonine protein kinase
MEYASNGTLKDLLDSDKRPKTEKEILRVFTMICLALFHTHKKHVIHFDLKPANILIGSDNLIKFADFGLSKKVDSTKASISKAELRTSLLY